MQLERKGKAGFVQRSWWGEDRANCRTVRCHGNAPVPGSTLCNRSSVNMRITRGAIGLEYPCQIRIECCVERIRTCRRMHSVRLHKAKSVYKNSLRI
jgi:hypothetical protein